MNIEILKWHAQQMLTLQQPECFDIRPDFVGIDLDPL
jgi:hypothetical protein